MQLSNAKPKKRKINEHQYTFHLKVYKNEGKIPSKWRLEAPKPKKENKQMLVNVCLNKII